MKKFILFSVLAVAAILPQEGLACELCSVFNSVESTTGRSGEFQAGIAYQNRYSNSSKRPDGRPFLGKQSVTTNTWQLMGNYFIEDSVILGLNIPITYRNYKRYERGRVVDGTESGLGDITALLRYQPVRYYADDWSALLEFNGGIKLPTGDSDPLKRPEEDGRDGERIGSDPLLRHGAVETEGNLVGGDDIALGTGSWDIPLGSSGFFSYGRNHLTFNTQYFIRNEGRDDYEFADDFQWQLSLGRFLALDHEYSVAPRLRFTGETKGKDTQGGEELERSDETNMFLGPEIVLTTSDNLFALVAVEFALENDDSTFELSTKRRMLASILYRF